MQPCKFHFSLLEVLFMSYVQRVLDELKAKNPAQPEFIQAATEVLTSLEPVLEKHPEFEKAALLERIVEPERQIMFRVPGLTITEMFK